MSLNFLDNYNDNSYKGWPADTDMDTLYDIGTYKDPSWVDNDFFDYDPKKTDGIDWSDIYANPEVLKGTGDNSDLLGKGLEFLGKFAGDSYSDQTSQYYDKLKTQSGLPTDKPSNSWYSQVPGTNVGFYGGGGLSWQDTNALLAQVNANTARNMGVGTPGGMRMAGQGLDIHDLARMGSGVVQGRLTDMALGAVPGIGPALVIANKVYPGGLPAAAKDVSRFAGDAVGGIANVAGDVVGGIVDVGKSIWDNTIGRLCDERLKVDIAPLESTEVNDELAQMAFFVKGLHECS